jgi:hypothetical protein
MVQIRKVREPNFTIKKHPQSKYSLSVKPLGHSSKASLLLMIHLTMKKAYNSLEMVGQT